MVLRLLGNVGKKQLLPELWGKNGGGRMIKPALLFKEQLEKLFTEVIQLFGRLNRKGVMRDDLR